MAAYKVLTDVEAEDKLLGPLSFRQFVYGLVCMGFLFLAWFVASNGALFLSPIFLPPAAVAGFFAFPWGHDQPTELWALAKIRFMLKPRKRVWDQSGIKELVTITAPKRSQAPVTKNLSQTEVKSRLRALADTLDSHGWVIKQTGAFAGAAAGSDPDRLMSASAFQQPEPQEVTPAEDMFDEQNNNAQRVSNLVNASSKKRRQKVMEELNEAQEQPQQQPKDYWFLNQPNGGTNVPDDMVTFNTQVVAPQGDTNQPSAVPGAAVPQQKSPVNEDELVKELEARKQESPMKSYYEHMHKVLPLSEQKKQAAAKAKAQAEAQAREQSQAAAKPPAQPQPQQPSPERQAAMRRLAGNNDLSVATLAREANEVVVKLH